MSYHLAEISGENLVVRVLSMHGQEITLRVFQPALYFNPTESLPREYCLAETKLTLPCSSVRLGEIIYGVKPSTIIRDPGLPSSCVAINSLEDPHDEGHPFFMNSQRFRKAISSKMVGYRSKGRGMLRLSRLEFDLLFKGFNFKSRKRSVKLGKLLFTPPGDPTSKLNSSSLSYFQISSQEIERRLQDVKEGNSEVVEVKIGEKQTLQAKAKAMKEVLYPNPQKDCFHVENFRTEPDYILQRSFTFSEIKELEARLGLFTSKTPKGSKTPIHFIRPKEITDLPSIPSQPKFEIIYCERKTSLGISFTYISQ